MEVNSHGGAARGLEAARQFKRPVGRRGAAPKPCDRLLQIGRQLETGVWLGRC
jgi:hypothetical protein